MKKTEKKTRKKTTHSNGEIPAADETRPYDPPSTPEEVAENLDATPDDGAARIVDVDMPHAGQPEEEMTSPGEEEPATADTDLIIQAVSELYVQRDNETDENQEDLEDEETFIAEEGYGEIVESPPADDSLPAAEDIAEGPGQARVESLQFNRPSEEEEEPEALPSEIEEETAFIDEVPEAMEFQTAAELKSAIECLLFTTPHPLNLPKLRAIIGRIDMKTLRGIVLQLQAEYVARGSGVQILENAEGFQMCTRPEYANVILRLHRQRKKNPLTVTALETLAIIAYKQPITRAEIEMIRGVETSGVIRNLLDMGMLRVVGRKEVIGRPQLYGTTSLFLTTFGLKSIHDLPAIQDLRRRYAASPQTNQLPQFDRTDQTAQSILIDEPNPTGEITSTDLTDPGNLTDSNLSDPSDQANPTDELDSSDSPDSSTASNESPESNQSDSPDQPDSPVPQDSSPE